MVSEKPDYQLYKTIGGYLYDKYGDRFFSTVPDLKSETFESPLVFMGDYSLQQNTQTKGALVSRASVTIHAYNKAEDQYDMDQLEKVMADLYDYVMKLKKTDNYLVEFDPQYTINSRSFEQEDNIRLVHGTLDVTFRI